MKSSKWILGLMAAMLIMVSASSSFAQVQIIISNTPSAGELQTARNAQTSDPTSVGAGITITGSLLANSPLTTTTLTLSFGAPISSAPAVTDGTAGASSGAVPTSDPIRIEGGTGVFASVVAVATVNFSAGTVTVNLPGFPAGNNSSGSFRLLGVRNDVNGKTAPLSVTASLSSSANNYIPPSNPTQPTISALGTWGTPTQSATSGQTNNGTILMFTNQSGGTYADALATARLDEGFASAWRTATQVSTNGTTLPNGTNIRMTINGLPSGVTVSVTSPGSSTTANRPGVAYSSTTLSPATSSAPTANQSVISFSSTNLAAVESTTIQFTISGTPGTLTPGSITVSFDLDPLAAAFTTAGLPDQTGGYPRFATDPKGPITIGSIVAANTTLLIPYAVRISSLNFETGIALANTTKDPFGGTTLGGATAAAGTVTLTLYPSTATGVGTEVTYVSNTANRAGSGMATDGTIPAGAVWAVNLTDVLSKAGFTGDFSGYIFIQANFLNAHGVAYVYDGRGFTSNTPLLVLPPPVSTPRNGIFESLNN